MKEYLDKFWEITGKVIKLWPFVAALLVILILAITPIL